MDLAWRGGHAVWMPCRLGDRWWLPARHEHNALSLWGVPSWLARELGIWKREEGAEHDASSVVTCSEFWND